MLTKTDVTSSYFKQLRIPGDPNVPKLPLGAGSFPSLLFISKSLLVTSRRQVSLAMLVGTPGTGKISITIPNELELLEKPRDAEVVIEIP
jgi:hypothetical protein